MSLNPRSTGKTYEAAPVEIARSAAMFFALSAGDAHDVYFDDRRPGGVIVPPMFAAVYARGPVKAALNDAEVGIAYNRMVHYAQTFHWGEKVRPGDVIETRAHIKDIHILKSGGVLTLETQSVNQRGKETSRGEWAFFDRSAGRPDGAEPRKTKASDAEKGPFLFETRVEIPNGQTFVYAEASGDKNPLHTDDAHAETRGLPGIIVHGFCTMSHCHKVTAAALCPDDPTRLKTLGVRFSRPVLPGAPLLFKGVRAKDKPPGVFDLVALNQAQKAVLKDAFCIVEE